MMLLQLGAHVPPGPHHVAACVRELVPHLVVPHAALAPHVLLHLDRGLRRADGGGEREASGEQSSRSRGEQSGAEQREQRGHAEDSRVAAARVSRGASFVSCARSTAK